MAIAAGLLSALAAATAGTAEASGANEASRAPGAGGVGSTGLDGRWRASFTAAGGEGRAADVTIAGTQGTWAACPRRIMDPMRACTGRARPIVVVDSGASTVTLRLATTLARGRDAVQEARLTIVDERTLEGELRDGRILRLERAAR